MGAAGVRTSKGRVLRLMREAGLLAPTRVGRRRRPRVHDGTITSERPDEMWGADAAACLTTREGNAIVFIAVDHCTQECVGIHAARPGTRFEVLEALRQGLREHFEGYGEDIAAGLALRHDHGSQDLSDHFQHELRTDITEQPTREGKLYCAAVLDVYSRRIVGWSIADHFRRELVVDALEMAR